MNGKALQNYIEELKSDVASLVYSDGERQVLKINLQNIALKFLNLSENQKVQEFCLTFIQIVKVE